MTPLDRIYPAPRLLRIVGGTCRLPTSRPAVGQMPARAERGAYRIELSVRDGLSASAADIDGRHSARTVLAALLREPGAECPAFVIEDAPAYLVRGVMLDVSRCRIPSMRHFREIIDAIASLRYNHLQLYVEHTFSYRGHEALSAPWSPITADEVATLEIWCSARGIELAANQNCFGHLAEWLAHPGYRELAETHGPYDFYGITRNGPFSLCPTDPGSLSLVSDWLGQLSECYQSRLVNIGCDETADVGTGRSAEAVAALGRGSVYAAYVSRVAEAAMAHGLVPMFWADIALEHAEVLDTLPALLLALAWGYEPDAPFLRWGEVLAAHGRKFWVCPGTSCWRSFAGRTAERRGALRAAVEPSGADGFMVTLWGDLGHRQQWPVSLHALADAACFAWHGASAVPDASAAGAHCWDSAALGRWLDDLGDADRHLRSASGGRGVLRNAGAMFDELHPARAGQPRGSAREWSILSETLDHLARTLPSCDRLTEAHLRWTLDVCRFSADLAVARRTGGRIAYERLSRIIDEHERLWQAVSRPGGLRASTAYFEALGAELSR